MTFEEWFGSNRHLLKSEGKDRQIFTAEDLEDAWNAAIASVDASLDSLADAGGDITWHSLDLKLKELKSS